MLTERSVPGDLLVHVESLQYCTKSVTIRNTTGSTVTLGDVVGQPLKAGTGSADYNIAEAGDEANVIALLLDGPIGQCDNEVILDNGYGVNKYQALVHPPAILNLNACPVNDVLGIALNWATIRTALEALKFEFRKEPTNSSTL